MSGLANYAEEEDGTFTVTCINSDCPEILESGIEYEHAAQEVADYHDEWHEDQGDDMDPDNVDDEDPDDGDQDIGDCDDCGAEPVYITCICVDDGSPIGNERWVGTDCCLPNYDG